MIRVLFTVVLCLGLSASGELIEGDVLEKFTYNGEEFENVTIRKVTPAYVEIMHSYGGETIYIHKLDAEIREEHFPNYNLEEAKKFAADEKEYRRQEAEKKKAEILKLIDDNGDKILKVSMLKVLYNVGSSGFLVKYKYWKHIAADNYKLTDAPDTLLIESTSKVKSGQLIPAKIAKDEYENKLKLYEIGTYTYVSGNQSKTTVKKYTLSARKFVEYLQTVK
ncbi:MAG: hypothetical protein MK132_16080 [Lentisphaerales bacterium]|nr:hypothetical protein [Lentisphaerales bacterium]